MAMARRDPPIAHDPRSHPLIHVIGCNAAGPEALPLAIQALLGRCGAVAAPARFLPLFRHWLQRSPARKGRPQPPLATTNRLNELTDALEGWLPRASHDEPIAVLASGDPLWFGIGRVLIQRFDAALLCFHPAPSSLQLAFARLQRPWQDASWVSVHGRDPEPLATALKRRPPALVVLPDPGRGGVDEVRRILRASGLEACYRLWICSRLGHAEESVREIPPSAPLPDPIDPLHLAVLLADRPTSPPPSDLPLFGLDDGLWHQHADQPGLMSKREVRVQLLADLELPPTGVLWDLGAGVGSVGLEALRLRPGLRLYAVERRSGAEALVGANARLLGVQPAAILEVDALDALADPDLLPTPDRVLIGGGGSRRVELLERVLDRLAPGGHVVIPLATIEALAPLKATLDQRGLAVQISQQQSCQGVPLADGTRLLPMNPVLILRGRSPAADQDAGASSHPAQ